MPPAAVRVHRIPFSTNVERVAIAAALKGVPVSWVDHDAADRSAVEALSGQRLVPVAELPDGRVVVDSMAIVAELERLAPSPALWPTEPARRAEVDVFVDWFNRVWKVAPNVIADALEAGRSTDEPELQRAGQALRGSLERFEALVAERPYLLGDELGAADVCAYPFLKYGARGVDPTDHEVFHRVLADGLRLDGDHPRVAAWIERVARVAPDETGAVGTS